MNPSQKFQHPRDPVQLSTDDGEVLSTDSSTITEVFSNRVGLPDSKGNRDLAVSSETRDMQEFWYRNTAGKESQIKLDGISIPLRPGHKISVIFGATDHGNGAVPLAVMNHSMGELYFVAHSLLDQLGALPPRLKRLSLICVALMMAFSVVFWNPIAGIFAVFAYVAFRVFVRSNEIKDFNRKLASHLQDLSRSLASAG